MIFPPSVLRIPVNTSASSDCPLPSTPAIPKISPPLTSREISFSAIRFLSFFARTFFISKIFLVASTEPFSNDVISGLPTIMLANSSLFVSDVFTFPTTFPSRRTVTLSLTCITSSSLCVMKIIDSPCLTMDFRVANNEFTS